MRSKYRLSSIALRAGSVSALACLAVQAALHAQVAANVPMAIPIPASPSKSGRLAKISADRTDDKTTAVGTVMSLLGHAKIISDGTTTLTTDVATYNRKTGVANAPGHLQIDDPQNTITGDSGLAYYTKRDAKITGNVHITVRPKPEMKNSPEGSARREFKNPVYITCDHVDYDWKARVAVATGNLIMKSDDRTVTAEKATYYGNNETVVLTGKVHYSRPNNDFGNTAEAVAILTEGHEQFYTNVPAEVSVTVDEEEDNGTQSGAAPIPPPPGSKPSAKPGDPATPATTPAAPPAIPPPPAAPPVSPPTSPPAGGTTTSSGGTTAPAGGTTPPSGGTTSGKP